ncbi:hypothetical protein P280DRAFT_522285 [Massarina eburnea CBS 473.64]|uniref:Uncharacterized protein n=1 Tax=Massarina eburnea CBS 473.64 TaxID=1395130 RepID=A0A6A6RQN4_9PLEO|nr:hypothetical protein P280DRAFT_522285 [Massarina eburnea CBS 473.64]
MRPQKPQQSVPTTRKDLSNLKNTDKEKMKSASKMNSANAMPGLEVEKEQTLTFLPNGLISMEKTPVRLVEIVKRNSLKSPLLRLPAEIRQMIWNFATSGSKLAIIKLYHTHKGYVYCLKTYGQRYQWGYRARMQFRLPEVCRQINSEMATLPYSNCIFAFPNFSGKDFHDIKTWSSRLSKGHRNAITDVSISTKNYPSISLAPHKVDREEFKSLRTIFPAIQRVYLELGELEKIDPPYCQNRAKQMLGDDVKVVSMKD